MALRLAARFVTLHPYKIADLQENDTAAHLLDLNGVVPEGTVAILIKVTRVTGTGEFVTFPRSQAVETRVVTHKTILVPIQDLELKWKNTAANDDWDIDLLGYFVQKRTR